MFSQSQLYKQRFYTSGIRISIGIIIIGVLFKIMHWPGYKEILLISLSVIPVLYFIWLIRKPEKSQLDLIKVVWVVVTYLGAILTLLHQLYGHELLQLSYFLFWIMFFDFIYVTYRKAEQA
ncbi:GldL-related protein [Xanthocytophaga flava]|uniref:GldL-related protein n=1 Tax=Xanthocytophaga flava TaxID=3048013 RepID=UPI0028D3B388|nr:hypothetical protein [Xanthocytophaga flavus]MDJ1471807.1 hypothetical protein [Xanthocytophaga flavus]